jgi:hypothetical protein
MYGAYVQSNSNPRMVYERLDQPGKVASVNHVTRAPQEASALLTEQKKQHTDYVPLGKFVGADTPNLYDTLQRRKAKDEVRDSSKGPRRGRALPKGVRRS